MNKRQRDKFVERLEDYVHDLRERDELKREEISVLNTELRTMLQRGFIPGARKETRIFDPKLRQSVIHSRPKTHQEKEKELNRVLGTMDQSEIRRVGPGEIIVPGAGGRKFNIMSEKPIERDLFD